MSRRRAPAIGLAMGLMAVAMVACAGGGGAAGTTPRSSDSRITAEEFEAFSSLDLYSVIQRLRPRWLQVRGGVTAQGQAQIAIFVDGTRQQGNVEMLRSFRSADVAEIRFLTARDATTRYGTDMAAGAIEVMTKH